MLIKIQNYNLMKNLVNFVIVFLFAFASINSVSAQMQKSDSTYLVIIKNSTGKLDTTKVKPGADLELSFSKSDSVKILNSNLIQKDKNGKAIDTLIKIKANGSFFYMKKSQTNICYNADGSVDFNGPASDTELPSTKNVIWIILVSICVLVISVIAYRRRGIFTSKTAS